MNSSSYRWPLMGIAAGALCLALAAAPGLANPPDDNQDSTPQKQTRKEVRVYRDNDSNDNDTNNGDDQSGEVRDNDNDNDNNNENDNNNDNPSPEVRKEIRVYRGDNSGEAQVHGGYLGVRVQDVTDEMREAKDLPNTDGALVSRVEPGSPAGKAGLMRGDVIVEVDRHKIDDASELMRRVGDMEPGSKVTVVVNRKGMRKTITVSLGSRPREFSMMVPPGGHGGWMQHADGNMPPEMPQIGEQLDRIREYRQDVQKQLNEIQDQLSRLRQGDLQRLENEIRALRDELRARDERKAPHSD